MKVNTGTDTKLLVSKKTMSKILDILSVEIPKRGYTLPIVDAIHEDSISKNAENIKSNSKNDAFKVLVATILSTRTRDIMTAKAVKKLFPIADSPEDIVKLHISELENLIKNVGFYRVKARNLKKMSKILIDKYKGNVPNTMDELLELPGVGRKVANLVLSVSFNKDAICVDTHVHRITNRIGFVKTKTPFETEMGLRKKLPKKYWKKINFYFVTLGQNICLPIKPKCGVCPIKKYCKKRI